MVVKWWLDVNKRDMVDLRPNWHGMLAICITGRAEEIKFGRKEFKWTVTLHKIKK